MGSPGATPHTLSSTPPPRGRAERGPGGPDNSSACDHNHEVSRDAVSLEFPVSRLSLLTVQ